MSAERGGKQKYSEQLIADPNSIFGKIREAWSVQGHNERDRKGKEFKHWLVAQWDGVNNAIEPWAFARKPGGATRERQVRDGVTLREKLSANGRVHVDLDAQLDGGQRVGMTFTANSGNRTRLYSVDAFGYRLDGRTVVPTGSLFVEVTRTGLKAYPQKPIPATVAPLLLS